MADVVRLAQTKYHGSNHTHLSELLSEREGIDIARTTLRRILVNAGLSSPRKRRPPKHGVRRQRIPREGMLVQLDGSYHPWLGDDRPQFTLLIAVDDATGCVVNASFSEKEDERSYFLLIQGLVQRCGIPLAPSTPTGTVSSGTHQDPASPVRQPSSAGRWTNWGVNCGGKVGQWGGGTVDRQHGGSCLGRESWRQSQVMTASMDARQYHV